MEKWKIDCENDIKKKDHDLMHNLAPKKGDYFQLEFLINYGIAY